MLVRKRDSIAWRWKKIGVGWFITDAYKVNGWVSCYRRESGIYLRLYKLAFVWIVPGHKWHDRWTWAWPDGRWI